MTQAKDKDLPMDEMSSSAEITLMNKWWGLVLKLRKVCQGRKLPRPSLAEVLGNELTAKMAIPEIRLGWTSTTER